MMKRLSLIIMAIVGSISACQKSPVNPSDVIPKTEVETRTETEVEPLTEVIATITEGTVTTDAPVTTEDVATTTEGVVTEVTVTEETETVDVPVTTPEITEPTTTAPKTEEAVPTKPVTEQVTTPTKAPTATTAPKPTETTKPTEAPKPQFTYTDLSQTMYTTQSVNVRSIPSTDGAKLGTLNAGAEVKVTGQCKENKWYRVEYNGKVGYCSNNYLSNVKPTPVPTKAPEKPVATPTKTPSASNSNLSEAQKKYPYGEKYTFSFTDYDGNVWNGAIGYYEMWVAGKGYYQMEVFGDSGSPGLFAEKKNQSIISQALVDEINRVRKANGLNPVKSDSTLLKVVDIRIKDLLTYGYRDNPHYIPSSEEDVANNIARNLHSYMSMYGYDWMSGGKYASESEIIQYGVGCNGATFDHKEFATWDDVTREYAKYYAKNAIEKYMGSPGHKAIILTPELTLVGARAFLWEDWTDGTMIAFAKFVDQ